MQHVLASAFALVGLMMFSDLASAQQQPVAAPRSNTGLTRDQFIERAKKRAEKQFDAMDTNHDGVVTRDEQQAARAARKAGQDDED